MSPPADHAHRAAPPPPPRPGRWPLGFALLLAAAGLYELATHKLQRRAVPRRADWFAAARYVRTDLKPGDLIVTAPGWADPLGRLVLGDRMTLDDVTRPDARPYRRLWELSIRGAHHPDTRGLRQVRQRTFGGVTATLYRQTPVAVTADLYAQIDRAHVWEERGGRRQGCRWNAGRLRHDCGPGWNAVHQIRAEIGYAARRCVYAHPIDGATRVIEYPRTPLGQRLVVWTGLNDYDPRYRVRRAVWDYQQHRAGRRHTKRPPPPVTSVPVTMEVLVAGQHLGRLAHPIEDEGWRRHVLELPPALRGQRAAVQLRIHTRHAWKKMFCYYARSEGAVR